MAAHHNEVNVILVHVVGDGLVRLALYEMGIDHDISPGGEFRDFIEYFTFLLSRVSVSRLAGETRLTLKDVDFPDAPDAGRSAIYARGRPTSRTPLITVSVANTVIDNAYYIDNMVLLWHKHPTSWPFSTAHMSNNTEPLSCHTARCSPVDITEG
nr:hypothetical protein [Haladaptatus halobius]